MIELRREFWPGIATVVFPAVLSCCASVQNKEPEPPSLPEGVSFTQYDERPSWANREEVQQVAQELYGVALHPQRATTYLFDLRDSSDRETADSYGVYRVWLFITKEGVVEEAQRHRSLSSGSEVWDVTNRMLRQMRFAPARHEGEAVDVWFPVTVILLGSGGGA